MNASIIVIFLALFAAFAISGAVFFISEYRYENFAKSIALSLTAFIIVIILSITAMYIYVVYNIHV